MSIIDDISGTKVVVQGKELDLSDLFDIDENDLTREFATQASLYAYFATLQAKVERDVVAESIKKDQEYASADEHWRQWYTEREKKYTEAVIRSDVIRDEDYMIAEDSYNMAVHDLNIVKALVRALQQRAEMLISMGAHLRQEYSMTGMTIKQHEHETAVKKAKETLAKSRR